MESVGIIERGKDRIQAQGMLFEYSLKLLLLVGFLELVLYRLVSRLGMHLSKLSEKYEFVRIAFQGISSAGFMLLNLTAILVFVVLFLLLFQKMSRIRLEHRYDRWLVPLLSFLVLLTITFLFFPPAMLGAIVYNLVASMVLVILTFEYMSTHRAWVQRAMMMCFIGGIFGWLYYQTISTGYGLVGAVDAPPFAHEANRIGEALMVVASILVFWAYGGVSLRTKNKVQRRRVVWLGLVGGMVFLGLLFMDFFLSLYSPAVARGARRAGESIGWIFQMGMGYTFYLPFALYVAGLIGWAYTVIKLVWLGRLAGFGLGLMFIAGYALQLSHLTLMVILGLMLLNAGRRETTERSNEKVRGGFAYEAPAAALGHH